MDALAAVMNPDMNSAMTLLVPMLSANIQPLNWYARCCHRLAQSQKQFLDFVGDRLEEDAAFFERVGKIKDPGQLTQTCMQHVQKAAQDYQTEFSEFARLSGDFSNYATDALQDLSVTRGSGAVLGE